MHDELRKAPTLLKEDYSIFTRSDNKQAFASSDDLTFLHDMIEYPFETFACANRSAGRLCVNSFGGG